MNSEKITLPDFLIADLYKESLVDIGNLIPKIESVESQALINSTESAAIKYLGENSKGIAILVNEEREVFIEESELTFLTNVLKACALTIADIAIINTATTEVSYQKLKELLGVTYILTFNVDPHKIKLPFIAPAFQVQNYDGCTIMSAPSLTEMNQQSAPSIELKRSLWTSLKKIFNI